MSKASTPSGKSNPAGGDPGSDLWRDGEADKEIAGLRNALDEHLRSLDILDSPVEVSKNALPATDSLRATRDEPGSAGVSGEGGRSGLFASAVVLGLILGASLSISLVALERTKKSVVTSEATRQAPVIPLTSPQSNQVMSAPPPTPNTSPSPTGGVDRAEPGTDAGVQGRSSPESTAVVRWQACLDQEKRDAEPPQRGETWWPVVGPGDSLNDARRHCRADAFINRSGNAQISSFRDRDTATAFAEQLTRDSSHPWRFWIGDPSVR